MTGMDDLVAWLRAQLDEDERAALAFEVSEGVWRCRHCGAAMNSAARLDAHLFETGYREWGPARMRDEVDAKRRILDWVEAVEVEFTRAGLGDRTDGTHLVFARWLAPPYADRPGYQESWRSE